MSSRVFTSRIGIIDPHPVTRHGIRQLFGKGRLSVCWEAESSLSAEEILKRNGADVVIYEPVFEMALAADFIEAVRNCHPNLVMIVHTMVTDVSCLREATEVGARALVSKTGKLEDLASALELAIDGQAFISSDILNRMYGEKGEDFRRNGVSRLTAREREVFQMVGLGQKASQIASALGISPRTVDAHKQHIKDKLGLDGNTRLAAAAGSWVQRSS